MLSFSLINETSTSYVDPSEMADMLGYSHDSDSNQKSFFDILNINQKSYDNTPPVKDDGYYRDELGDMVYGKNGLPLEKSDVGVGGFMKRLIGKSNYDQLQNGSGRTIDLAGLFNGKHQPSEKSNYENVPPEEKMWW